MIFWVSWGCSVARTALYRHYDKDGVLLYVGISLSAIARLAQPRRGARWFEYISRVEIEQFDSRKEALQAEKDAIAKEQPFYNKANASYRKGQTEDTEELLATLARDVDLLDQAVVERESFDCASYRSQMFQGFHGRLIDMMRRGLRITL